MTSSTVTHRLVISSIVLVVAGAVTAAAMLTSRPTSADEPGGSPSPTMSTEMPGMNHGSGEIPKSEAPNSEAPKSSPSPTMSTDMPGMEHGSAEVPGKTHDDGAAEVPGKTHDDGSAAVLVPDQPLAAVLGTFGVGSGAVMLSAGALRHRDRARSRVKEATRAARRSLV